MHPFTVLEAVAVPLPRANVDTDQIIPKQFLKSIARTGFGKNLFHDWRYLDGDESRPDPDFVLNHPACRGGQVLVARENFGCGSSREHAAWALTDYGFRCVIAPGYSDIFYNNALKNGLLPAVVSAEAAEVLLKELQGGLGARLRVDLAGQTITSPSGIAIPFDISPEAKRRLLEGLDDISLTLLHEAEITAFEERRGAIRPWL